MAQRDRTDDRGSAPELKFYLPAVSDPSFATDWLEWIWTRLFSHGTKTPR